MKKGTQEMKDYMKLLRAQKKGGQGLMDNMKSGLKFVTKQGIDYGSNKLKEKIDGLGMKKKGQGLAGEVLKFGSNKIIDMTGLGMSTRVNAKGRLLIGSALVNAGY